MTFVSMRQQNVIDIESYRSLKASERALDAGKMDEQDARDLIVRAIAGLYLNAQSAAARADAAASRVTDSSTLLKLAQDKHDAGTATGVDVLRAEVQLAKRQAGAAGGTEPGEPVAAGAGAEPGDEPGNAAGTGRAASLPGFGAVEA